jgi:deazaflavin-dependent oxidoreductase (nitroreductase family)
MPADSWLQRHPPTGAAKWLLRLPLVLHRCRLRWLLDHRFLVVSHRGRVSGRVHRTVVEVVRYDTSKREAVVITPWPTTANWYRNVMASPAAEVWIGAARYRPHQRALDPDEVEAALDAYAKKSPAEALGLRRLLGRSSDLCSARRLIDHRGGVMGQAVPRRRLAG